jgi:hypothetical protein
VSPRSKKPPTREQLVAKYDAAIELTSKRRTALRLAERAMLEAREQLQRFDELAAWKGTPPCR